MFVTRRTKFGHHREHLSLKRFLFLLAILQVTTIYDSLANRIDVLETQCAKRWTCRSCTEITTPACSWSVAEQSCVNSAAVENRLVVTDRSLCPKFGFVSPASDNGTKVGLTLEEGQASVVNGTLINITVDVGQVFAGIASGGTTLRVRGKQFSGLQNTKACIKTKYLCGLCEVHNDTLMVCRSPATTLTTNQLTDKKIRFYEQDSTTGIFLKLNHSSLDVYHPYQDPVFTDFVLDGCCNVTVHGLQLDKGYAAEDLSIALVAENSSSGCQVTSMDSTQITCQLSSSSRSDLPPNQINVTVGNFQSVVNLTNRISNSFKSSLGVTILPTTDNISLEVVQSNQPLGVVGPASDNGTKVGLTLEEGQALVVNGTLINITVDVGQVFAGIASGGTTLRVRGQHFSGLQNAKSCIINKYNCGRCEVHNDTLMVCRSPATTLTTNPLTDEKIRFYEQDSTTGIFLKLNHSSLDVYHPYQDPVFTDFVLDGCCNVTVHGLQLDQGYAAEDLSISLAAEISSSGCQVTSMNSTQITCQLSSSSRSHLPPNQINVTVGNFLSVVNLTNQKSSSFKSSLGALIILPGTVTKSLVGDQSGQPLGFVSPASDSGTKVGQTLGEGQASVVNGTLIYVTVDVGQVFAGIASGGTTLRVRGQHFSGLQNTKACIKTKYNCGLCEVHNDTLMVCRSPATTLTTNPLTDKKIRFYEQDSTTGIFLKLNHSSLDVYHPYQDPVFTDFVLDGCCNVTIHGLQLDKGYAAEDLSIALVAENSSSGCQVTSMDSTQITCQLSSSSRSDLPPKQLNVTIGDLLSVVNPTIRKSSGFKSSLGVIIFPGIVTISAYVLFIAVLCVALVYMKASKDYDLLHSHGSLRSAEMRPLGDLNPNNCENDPCESENMLTRLSARDETY